MKVEVDTIVAAGRIFSKDDDLPAGLVDNAQLEAWAADGTISGYKSLEQMSKSELVAEAARRGVAVNDKDNASTIREALQGATPDTGAITGAAGVVTGG